MGDGTDLHFHTVSGYRNGGQVLLSAGFGCVRYQFVHVISAAYERNSVVVYQPHHVAANAAAEKSLFTHSYVLLFILWYP
jgi:hypothetical protein